jgi:Transglycosylase SLT domain
LAPFSARVNRLFTDLSEDAAMRRLLPFIYLFFLSFAAHAASPCRAAIESAEQRHSLPPHLLAAIARVESGRADRLTGRIDPWPWTINADGQGSFLDDKAQAIAAVGTLRSRGVRSIDVGCLQVNLMHHPDAFPDLEQAFDPGANADYAARLLLQLHQQTHAWPAAVALYHSTEAGRGAAYQKKVLAAWPEEQGGDQAFSPAARLWGATLPSGAMPAFGRVLRTPSTAAGMTGRDLASYRAAPVLVAAKPPRPAGG